ncbi:MAG: hypothetical protein JXA18_04260 [Chitinispirillaceae bacterium]|nr:hypothetical protein [Chitinispirillaceae bacterium]
MINKDKTINKAVSKYHAIFPVRGKHSIDECFFCLRGEYFFIFRTKDKKVHTLKAEKCRPVSASSNIKRETWDSIVKALNKPIIVRSLIVKKPVGTWLINLLPFPGISWSTNVCSSSRNTGTHRSERPAMGGAPARPPAPWAPAFNEASQCSYPPSHPVSNRQGRTPNRFSAQHYQPSGDTTALHYEILATGYLPARSAADWIPPLDVTAEYSYAPPPLMSNPPGRAENRFSRRQYQPLHHTTHFQYEILATGYLPARPYPDWLPTLDGA